MKISNLDIIRSTLRAYRASILLPSLTSKIGLILRPFDAVRYIEVSYLLKFLRTNNLYNLNVLDVSSPHIISYILSAENIVLKTNLDESEKRFIKENHNLSFAIEDATHLTIPNNTFDLTCSVSVIEHIYRSYEMAIIEMLRVTKPGGYVYITFPVSKKYTEEWSEDTFYTNQFTDGEKTFFQYRFDHKYVSRIIDTSLQNSATLINVDIFWEKKEGTYNKMISSLQSNTLPIIAMIKNILLNFYYGITLFNRTGEHNFSKAKEFGNIQIIFKKNA
ncbi:MAG: class I SAM-dependent methyltransferase [Candidatus Taylorbacteria bacterium]